MQINRRTATVIGGLAIVIASAGCGGRTSGTAPAPLPAAPRAANPTTPVRPTDSTATTRNNAPTTQRQSSNPTQTQPKATQPKPKVTSKPRR